jgi:hypothetical protein
MTTIWIAFFLQLLNATNMKTGAALLLFERTCCVLKLRDDGGDFVYDLIETLPVSKDKGMRIMCHDIDALAAALKTYAFG